MGKPYVWNTLVKPCYLFLGHVRPALAGNAYWHSHTLYTPSSVALSGLTLSLAHSNNSGPSSSPEANEQTSVLVREDLQFIMCTSADISAVSMVFDGKGDLWWQNCIPSSLQLPRCPHRPDLWEHTARLPAIIPVLLHIPKALNCSAVFGRLRKLGCWRKCYFVPATFWNHSQKLNWSQHEPLSHHDP